jgi:hypothetical protein
MQRVRSLTLLYRVSLLLPKETNAELSCFVSIRVHEIMRCREITTISSFDDTQTQWAQAQVVPVGSNRGKGISQADLLQVLDRMLIQAETQKLDFGLVASFEFKGHKMRLDVSSDGTGFIALGSCWGLPPDMEPAEVLPRLNRLNRKLRYVKLQWMPDDNSLFVSIEFMATGVEELAIVLGPYLKGLHHAARVAMA